METERLRALFDQAWAWEMEDSPEAATVLGYRGHDHRWSDLSPAAYERRLAKRREFLDAVSAVDRSALDEQDRLSAALFEKAQREEIEGARFHGEYQPVNQLQGVQQDPAMYVEAQPSATEAEQEAIVERLRGLPLLVEQTIELMGLGLAAGNTPPQLCLRDVGQQVRNQLVDDPFDSPLLAAFADEREGAVAGAAAAAFRTEVAPAYERFHDYFVDEYLPRTRTTTACRDLPDGEAWYAHLVRQHTTTDLTPAEIHEIGLAEVDRIGAEMASVAKGAGFDGLADYAKHLRTDPAQRHTTTEALLEGYRAIGRHVDAQLPSLFGMLPKLPYEIVAVPPYAEQSQTAAYYLPGAPDGSRPGQFFANTYDLPARFIWEMEALTLHEAVPGHHLQIALAQELDGLPDFRRHLWLTAYGEGWGLYAESLGEEVGLYRDPASKFGALTGEMWRAVRLVLDTGLHAFGWSRDRAIAYFQEATGRDDHDIVVEVDRYIVWPGQALGYKLGELRFKELRARAASALGPAFDVRAFHDEVLRHGCLPLDVLSQRVEAFVSP
ncbi:MAG: hypothetical protein QOF60_582 [Actinomycetota bacterium]|jgi:uncharacterized protein (DUF885 family)|nr:hypothetical protein [Actinomycetota bacterium]